MIFDYAIVGAGLSGLMLARRLLGSTAAGPVPGTCPRVLLVDPMLHHHPRTTFAFWTTRATPLDPWLLRQWHHLRVLDQDGRARPVDLAGYRYAAVAWEAARADLLAQLAANPNVTFLGASVDGVKDGIEAAFVQVGDEFIPARFVFDSRPAFPPVERPRRPLPPPSIGRRRPRHQSVHIAPSRRATTLQQSFRGVWVRSGHGAIDCSAATLLDFSADHGSQFGFGYVLPVSRHEALVMAVRIDEVPASPDPIPMVPRELGPDGWRVMAEEHGLIELQAAQCSRREGRRILAIGVRGGRVRPATGYAVTRILADTEAIAASLRRHGHPFAIPSDSSRDRVLDAIWLHALARDQVDLEPAFVALFDGVPADTILRFLDGGATARDLAKVIGALPPGHFMKSVARLAVGL